MVYIYFDRQRHDVAEILASKKFYGYEWCAVENCGGGVYKVTVKLSGMSERDEEAFMMTLKKALEDKEIKDATIHGVSDFLAFMR